MPDICSCKNASKMAEILMNVSRGREVRSSRLKRTLLKRMNAFIVLITTCKKEKLDCADLGENK